MENGGDTIVRMLTINCGGIRERRRGLRLADLLHEFRIVICGLAETHLRREAVGMYRFKLYDIVANCGREAEGRVCFWSVKKCNEEIHRPIEGNTSPNWGKQTRRKYDEETWAL